MSLYPLKFDPILKERIWGGKKLSSVLGKKLDGKENIGESWEISTVKDNVSVVSNGFFKGTSLSELISRFKEELVGANVYRQFKNDFPLLIKFIDANEDLSLQVHPNDKMAKTKHNSLGKTEMWYVLDDADSPRLVNGFNCDTSRQEVISKLNDSSFEDLLKVDVVNKGDAIFIPAGRIHAIGKGNLVAEIQQSSDITYRVYDYDRVDTEGNKRELHVGNALDALDYAVSTDSVIKVPEKLNGISEIVNSQFFKTSQISIEHEYVCNYKAIDSFVILIGIDGKILVSDDAGNKEYLYKGQVMLIPASCNNITLIALPNTAKLLEVYL